MLFNSLTFAAFMAVVFVVYWLIPERFRYILVFASSWYFYLGFGVKGFGFMVLATIISYYAAIFMQKKKDCKKMLCGLFVVLFVGALAFFKYINFFIETVSLMVSHTPLAFTPQTLKFFVPVGISFFSFKIISYLVEVNRGTINAQTNFIKYAAFVSFFPQVASGPIGRPAPFFDELNSKKVFNPAVATDAVRLLAVGLFKKMIVADKVAVYVSRVYSSVHEYDGFALMAAAFLFSIQIYCDFSGYSDIANAVANLLGFKETKNFKQPYFAASVKEFWARWHISLSSWFRDYIYIPLGGSRVGKFKYARNIIVVFLVSGLWHGANFTFVLWGLLHGVMQVIETFVSDAVAKVKGVDRKELKATGPVRIVKILLVFLFVTFAWIFFEADSVGDAFYVIAHCLDKITSPVAYVKDGLGAMGINSKMFIHLFVVIGMLFIYELLSVKKNVFKMIDKLPKVVRYAIYVIFIDLMIIWFMQYGADSGSFVYFEF